MQVNKNSILIGWLIVFCAVILSFIILSVVIVLKNNPNFNNTYGRFIDVAKPIHSSDEIYWKHAKTLKDGNVLTIGIMCNLKNAYDNCLNYKFISEIYSPKENKFYPNSELVINRTLFHITNLDDDKLLLTGGEAWGNPHRKYFKDVCIFDYKHPGLVKIGEMQNVTTYSPLVLKNKEIFIIGIGEVKMGKSSKKILLNNCAYIYKVRDNKLIHTKTYKNELFYLGSSSVTELYNRKILLFNDEDAGLFNPYTKDIKNIFHPKVYMLGSDLEDTKVILKDGRVLLIGNIEPYLIFDPKTEIFSEVRSTNLRRYGAGAILLKDGRVFIEGGITFNTFLGSPYIGYHAISDTEIYDPKTNKFYNSGYQSSPGDSALALLADGSVLIMRPKPQIFKPNY